MYFRDFYTYSVFADRPPLRTAAPIFPFPVTLSASSPTFTRLGKRPQFPATSFDTPAAAFFFFPPGNPLPLNYGTALVDVEPPCLRVKIFFPSLTSFSLPLPFFFFFLSPSAPRRQAVKSPSQWPLGFGFWRNWRQFRHEPSVPFSA